MFQLISLVCGRSQRWTALVAEQQNDISLRSSNVSARNARVTESPTEKMFSCSVGASGNAKSFFVIRAQCHRKKVTFQYFESFFDVIVHFLERFVTWWSIFFLRFTWWRQFSLAVKNECNERMKLIVLLGIVGSSIATMDLATSHPRHHGVHILVKGCRPSTSTHWCIVTDTLFGADEEFALEACS